MWWHKTALLAWIATVAACGFQPVYQQNARITALTSAIAIDAPRDRQGQIFTAALEDALHVDRHAGPKRYRLSAQFQQEIVPLSIESDGTIARYNIRVVSPFTITRLSDQALVHRGTVTRQSAYNVIQNEDYATFIAREDALNRVAEALAEDYRLRILSAVEKLDK